MAKYSVGLDIAKSKIDVCLSFIDDDQNVKVIASKVINNTRKGFDELISWLKKHIKQEKYALVIGMEATGVYYEECAYYLFDKGLSVIVILPNKAKKYFQAMGLKSKNDKIDAKGLSRMFAERKMDFWQPMGKFYYELRSMTRHQESLQNSKTALKNQLHALSHGVYQQKDVVKQIKKQISLVEKHIEEIKQKIIKHIKSDKNIEEKANQMASIKGVGILTVAVLLAETNGFVLFENCRQLVSYAGYDVVENQSGKRSGKTKISKKGNSHIRRALFMPAFSVITYEIKPFSDLFNRTFENHKIKMKSYVAVQKKLLVIMYSLWKKEVSFTDNFIETNTKEWEQESASLVELE